MTTYEIPQSARELGLMQAFPSALDQFVTHENQLYAPYNRWSFQNELKLNRTAEVWRGDAPASALASDLQNLKHVTFRNTAGETFTFDDMIERSYTDAIIVMHQGKVIYERYLNGMQPHTLHAWASGSKSMTGTLATLLLYEGLFDAETMISNYLPELKGTGFDGATVRHVMDMTAAIGFADPKSNPVAEDWRYGVALGWCEKTPDYDGAQTVYEFLPTVVRSGEHGVRFTYLTPNTDALAWLLKRLTGKTLAELMEQYIWSKLGAERDAYWIVDSATAETAGSGLITTARDMARFGQMMLQKGYYNGQQILPEAVINDIEQGADQEAFARGPAAGPGNSGYSYHHQWWVTHNSYGAYQALGYGGQMLYIAPGAELVVAKLSSYPTPTTAGQEFYSAFAALPALAKALAE